MSSLSTYAKRLVEKNIHLIEDSKFDELFNSLSYNERLIMAEMLLAAEIHFEGNTINKFKYQNIADFLNDLRIDKANIRIRKGPLSTTTYKVEENQYAVCFPEEITWGDPKHSYPNLCKKYNWVNTGQATVYNRYSISGVNYKTVLIFNI